MDRAEAYELAREQLGIIESAGYAAASEHIETATVKDVSTRKGTTYEVELSYHWKGKEHENILVICTVTSKNWFTHERLEASVTLCSGAI